MMISTGKSLSEIINDVKNMSIVEIGLQAIKLGFKSVSEKEIEDSYCYSRSYNQSVSKRSKVYTQMTSDFSSGLELLNEEK